MSGIFQRTIISLSLILESKNQFKHTHNNNSNNKHNKLAQHPQN